MIRRPPRSTLFPTRRSSDLAMRSEAVGQTRSAGMAAPARASRLPLRAALAARPRSPVLALVEGAHRLYGAGCPVPLGARETPAATGLCPSLPKAGPRRPSGVVLGETRLALLKLSPVFFVRWLLSFTRDEARFVHCGCGFVLGRWWRSAGEDIARTGCEVAALRETQGRFHQGDQTDLRSKLRQVSRSREGQGRVPPRQQRNVVEGRRFGRGCCSRKKLRELS